MSKMTYTHCPICQGSLRGVLASQTRECPCVRSGHPGWAPTGVTLAQIERMADLERALSGDPGMPVERRREVLAEVRRRPGWEAVRPSRRKEPCPQCQSGMVLLDVVDDEWHCLACKYWWPDEDRS